MNFKLFKACILSLLLLGNGAGYAASGQAVVDADARNVAEQYFAALSAGDRETLLSLLAGDELIRSESQLRDPAYSQFLTSRYSNARLEIAGSGILGDFRTVDIIIWLNEVESIKERLILRATESPAGTTYHIVSREEINI